MYVTPKASWPWVKAMLHSTCDQPDGPSVHARFDRVINAVADKLPAVADHLEGARADILAFTAFPKQIWRQIWRHIWSNNPTSASIERTGAGPTSSGSSQTGLPSSASSAPCWPSSTGVRAEGRRYLGLDVLARPKAVNATETEETKTINLQSLTI